MSGQDRTAAQTRIVEACLALVTAWATDPGLTNSSVPRLCEALRELDEFAFNQAFAAGVEASRV